MSRAWVSPCTFVFVFLIKPHVSNHRACCKIAKAEGHCCLPFLINVTLNISKFENLSQLSHSNHQVEWSYHHQEYWEIVVLTHHKRRVFCFRGVHGWDINWQNIFVAEEIICSDVPNGNSCKFFEREDLMAKPTPCSLVSSAGFPFQKKV